MMKTGAPRPETVESIYLVAGEGLGYVSLSSVTV